MRIQQQIVRNRTKKVKVNIAKDNYLPDVN